MADEDDQQTSLTPTRIWQNFKIPIILGSVSTFLIALSITLLIKSYQSTQPIRFSSDSLEASAAGTLVEIVVDVQGAIVRPGVYRLALGSRVEDAIGAAGGLSDEADLERISTSLNRAAKLSDGAKLYIPERGSGLTEDQGQTPVLQTGQVSGSQISSQVSVNAASQAELEKLSGIGPVTAKKIIDGRPYQTLEELVTRKVLFKSTYEKLKDQLTL